MPSDEMVEKAQTLDDAIDNALIAWGMGWDMDGVMACLKEAKDRAALSSASAEPVDVRAGAINSAAPVAIRPSPFREDLDMVAVAAEAETQPVAWMDDGTLRAGSTATAHRVVTDATKRGMPRAAADSFTVPLYASPSEAAIRADEREKCALIAESYADGKPWPEKQAGIATAIRARGER